MGGTKMGEITRRDAIKTALKAGAYIAPVVLAAAAVPATVGAQGMVSAPPGLTGLILTNVVNLPTVTRGAGVNFSINVVNRGPSVATNIVVTPSLPPGFVFSGDGFTGGNYNGTTFTITSLVVGGSASLILVIIVNATGMLTATLTATVPNPNPGISSARATVTVVS